MSIKYKGSIFVFNNPSTKQLEVSAVNHGPTPGDLTHNIRATRDEAFNKRNLPQHDDNNHFGHGDLVPTGTDAVAQTTKRAFPIGGSYNTGDSDQSGQWNWKYHAVAIQPGSWIRIGFRRRAWTALEIPAEGKFVEIPYQQLTTMGVSAMGNANMNGTGWETEPVVGPVAVPPEISKIAPKVEPRVVLGRARIVPIANPNDSSSLRGWEVWFENGVKGSPAAGQTHGFTATVVLLNRDDQGAKNAGLGLESMACPGENTRVQLVRMPSLENFLIAFTPSLIIGILTTILSSIFASSLPSAIIPLKSVAITSALTLLSTILQMAL